MKQKRAWTANLVADVLGPSRRRQTKIAAVREKGGTHDAAFPVYK